METTATATKNNKGKSSSNDVINNDAKALFGFSDTTCHNCGISNDDIGGFLLQCATCKKAYYCGMKCFNMNLPIHSKFCMTNELDKEPMGRHAYDATMTARIGPKDDAAAAYPDPPPEVKKSKKKKKPVAELTTKKTKKAVKKVSKEASRSESESETESESDSEGKNDRSKAGSSTNEAPKGDNSVMDTNNKDPLCNDDEYVRVEVENADVKVNDTEASQVNSDVENVAECRESDNGTAFGAHDDVASVADDNSNNGVADHKKAEMCQGTPVANDDDVKDETDAALSIVNAQDNDDEFEESTSRSRRGGGILNDAHQQRKISSTRRALRSWDASAQANTVELLDNTVKGNDNTLCDERHEVVSPNANVAAAENNVSYAAEMNEVSPTATSPSRMSTSVELESDVEETRKCRGGGLLPSCSLSDDISKDVSKVMRRSMVPSQDGSNDADGNPMSSTATTSPNSISAMSVALESDVEETRKCRGGGLLHSGNLLVDTAEDTSKVVLRPMVPSKHLVAAEQPEWIDTQLRDTGPVVCDSMTNAGGTERHDSELAHLENCSSTAKVVGMAGDSYIGPQRASSSFTLRSVKYPRNSSMSNEMLEAWIQDAKEKGTGVFQTEKTSSINRNEPTLHPLSRTSGSRTGGSGERHSMVDLSGKQRLDSLMLRPTQQTKCNAEWTKPEWVNCHLRATQRGDSTMHLGEPQGTADPAPSTVEPDWVIQRRRRMSGILQSQQQQRDEAGEAVASEAMDAPVITTANPSTKRHSLLKYQSCQNLDSGSRSSNLPDIVRRAMMLRKASSATNRTQCSKIDNAHETPSQDITKTSATTEETN